LAFLKLNKFIKKFECCLQMSSFLNDCYSIKLCVLTKGDTNMKQWFRRAEDRGIADHGWLKSAHSFSFAGYQDPQWIQFGPLRVINEDRVAPGQGFGTHGHRDMEIISYVLDGALAHRDSMGHGSEIEPGDVQRMSAGTGVMHSEFNRQAADWTHFLQIWIIPDRSGHLPSYEQKHFDLEQRRGRLALIVSPDGADGALTLNQDARIYAGCFDDAEHASLAVASDRRFWVQVARGGLCVNGLKLAQGDGLGMTDISILEIGQANHAEVLVFDLPLN
jgi:redox-sensitive bicupin YhaK (pirin superfamily)